MRAKFLDGDLQVMQVRESWPMKFRSLDRQLASQRD